MFVCRNTLDSYGHFTSGAEKSFPENIIIGNGLIEDVFSDMFFEIIFQEEKKRCCAQSAVFMGEEIFQSYLKYQTLISIFSQGECWLCAMRFLQFELLILSS